MMVSESVVLSAVEPEDVPQVVEWRNRPDINQNFIEYDPLSTWEQERFMERLSASANRRLWMINARVPGAPHPYHKAVRPTPDAVPIGMVGINNVDLRNRVCELAPLFIGDLAHRNYQVVLEAECLVLDHCFNHLGLHSVHAHVPAWNPDVIRLHRTVGFREEGRLRDRVFRRGRYFDLVVISLLDAEFAARFGARFGGDAPSPSRTRATTSPE